MTRQKIRPCLWFDGNGRDAAEFYVSVFKDHDSAVTGVTPGPNGAALVVEFRLAGVEFLALNGGPHFRFNEAISLSVGCKTQDEVDELWAKLLSAGAEEGQCGWIKDRYGLWWQIVPDALGDLLADEDRERAARVMEAMLKMRKIDVAELRAAYDGAA